MTAPSDEPAPQAPFLRIVNADATPEEIAAIVAIFAGLGSAGSEPPKRETASWNHPARAVRHPHRHGAGAWRASGLPR